MKKIRFRFVLSLFFLIISLGFIGVFVWVVAYRDNLYGGRESMISSLILLFILSSTLSLIFYKFNKLWARIVLYLLLLIFCFIVFYNLFIPEKKGGLINPDYYVSGPFLSMSPDESLPAKCLVTAIVNEPKAVSNSTMCTASMPPSCTTKTNYLIPLTIVSSDDILDQISSSSCAILINTTQYTDRVPEIVKTGQKIRANLVYDRYTSFEGYSYFYRLQNTEVIK